MSGGTGGGIRRPRDSRIYPHVSGGTLGRCAAAPPSAYIWIYPHVSGGTRTAIRERMSRWDLSPRERGNLTCNPRRRRSMRSIPTWAGETSRQVYRRQYLVLYPHVGGGNKA